MKYQYQLAIGLMQKVFNHYYNNVKYFFKYSQSNQSGSKTIDSNARLPPLTSNSELEKKLYDSLNSRGWCYENEIDYCNPDIEKAKQIIYKKEASNENNNN